MKILILILLCNTLVFPARKWMSGGELLKDYSGDAFVPYFKDNHPEQQSDYGSGANGFGGIYSYATDRTGYGKVALTFNATTGATFPTFKTFLAMDWTAPQTPLKISFWGKFVGGNPQLNTQLWTMNDSGKTLRIYWLASGKLGIAINDTLQDSTSGTVSSAWTNNIKLYTTWGYKYGAVHHYLILNNTDTAESATYLSSTPPTGGQYGMLTTSLDNTQTSSFYIDDIFVNDVEGTKDTGFAHDSSYVIFVRAVADTANSNFKNGDASTDSLWAALDNVQVEGVVTGSETKHSNIYHATSSTTDNYDAAVNAYTYSGMGASHFIWAAQAVVRTSEHDGTGTTQGAVSLVSNPSDTTEMTFNFGADLGVHIQDNWTTVSCSARNCADGRWVSYHGRVVYITDLAMVDKTIRPVVRVGRRTATTNKVCVDQLGIIIEANPYSPISSATLQGKIINNN
jgi:hypothetical protein